MSDLSGHGNGNGNGSNDVKVENAVGIAFSELVGKYGKAAGLIAKLVYSLELISGLVTAGRSQVDSMVLYSRYAQIANNILGDIESVLEVDKESAHAAMKWVALAVSEFSKTVNDERESGAVEQGESDEVNPLNVVQYSTVEDFHTSLKESANKGQVTVDSLESRTVH